MTETKVVEWGTYESGRGDISFDSTIELPEYQLPIHEDYRIDGVPFAWATVEARTDGLWMKTRHPMPPGVFLTPVFSVDDAGHALRVISLALTRTPPMLLKKAET